MILQCDQCNTKFRLDDSKLKPGGVKVRCSKCRHVFIAGAEQKHEESEFDALLSGLGAPAPSQAPEPAPPAADQQSAGAELAALEVGGGTRAEAPVEDRAEVDREVAAGDFGFGDVDFGDAAPAATEPAQPAGGAELGEFDFDQEPSTPPAAEREAPAADSFGFGEFSFDETPSAPAAEKEAPAADSFGFGEFSFDETPSAPAAEREAPAADSFGFGEFSFDETPSAPAAEKEAPAAAEPSGFDEFSFDETPAVPAAEQAAPAAGGPSFDFGEFSFEEPPRAAGEEKPAPAAEESLNFGEFAFQEEPAAPSEEKEVPPAPAGFDFGEFSFEETPAAREEAPAAAAADFGDFTFGEPAPGVAPATGVAEDFGSLPPAKEEKPASFVSEPTAGFTAGDFTFAEEPEPAPQPAPPKAAPTTAGILAASGAKEEAAQPAPSGKPAAASSLDFSFGEGPYASPVPEVTGEEDEELPPLSIVSRRKGRSAFTIAIIAVSAVVVIAMSAAGLYLLQSGPAAMAKLDQLGIGFVAQWFGIEVPEEGRIEVRNAQASFHPNQEAGELFVVNGEAVNSFRKPRASIQVRVSIFDKNGNVLVRKTAYCGNRLSKEQLATLPMEKIESIMNNQFGDSLSNLSVKPGEAIGFVVAMANVPKEAADFGVEVVGSTVAAGQ